jgi:hypothetical protein
MKKAKIIKLNLFFGLLLSLTVLLAACSGQNTDPNAQLTSIAISKEVTGIQPFPTVNPETIVGFTFVIGATEFYPQLVRGEVISAQLFNKGLTTVYISSCEGIILQQLQARQWIDIATVRRCGSQPQKLAVPSGSEQDVSFEFKKAYPLSKKPFPQWLTFGKHRLIFLFSSDCPRAINEFSECLNKQYYPSVEFDLKDYTTLITPTVPK